jgi:outer membrane protein assembly factor BamE (lipoprotein component of BamABCDE complex)
MMRALTLTIAASALVLTGGCTRVRAQQGYIADESLIGTIKPGVDNRDSVQRTLGRPTFAGQFESGDWYYVSRQTRQIAFVNPRPTKQMVLRIRFDARGNVAAVDRTGLEKIASISPLGTKTPTLGKDRSFFEELFGNIGQVGSVGRGGATADNPDGGN